MTETVQQWQCAAILVRHGADMEFDTDAIKVVLVPHGLSLELDDNRERPWLLPHVGENWHLHAFAPVEPLTTPNV